MSGILKIKRGGVDVGSLNDGEFYLNKNINAIQIGSGSTILTLVPLNQAISGDIILNGNIYANNLNISSSYALTSSYAQFAQTTGNVQSASYSNTSTSAATASYILSSNVFGPYGFNSILTASVALNAPGYLLQGDTASMLSPYLPIVDTVAMLAPYLLNSQTSSFLTNDQTSSFITNNQTSSFITNTQTSSFLLVTQTGSFITNTQTSSFLLVTQTGSFITNTQTSSMSVGTASFSTTASYALTASLALGVVGFGNLASSSYPFNVTGSSIYSHYSNIGVGNVTLPITSISNNFIVGEGAALRGYYTSSIILGYRSGHQVVEETGSSFNVFLGNEAGRESRNVVLSFLGLYRAGYRSQANNSVFIGREAGAISGLSSDSIFLGRRAGYGQTNVSNSVLIGFNVGTNLPLAESPMGSNNIVIGTNITLPNGYANSINLGGILFGSGSYFSLDTQNNPNKNPVQNGRIGINIYPTNYNLEVNGTANISNGLYVTNSINLTGSNNHIGNYTITGSINSTGSNTFIGNTTVTGSLLTSGSNIFSGLQTVSGSLNVMENLTVLGSASFYYFSTTYVTSSTITATGSNTFGDTVDDVQTLIGSVNISGSLAVTGSTYLTASNVTGGIQNYIPIWKTENSLSTSSLYEASSNVLIGTTTNPNTNFKLYVSGNIGTPSFQISSVSSSNNENYVGIWRPSGSQGNTHFLEATGSDPKHKWVFRGINGFGNKRDWDENGASIVNINMGWNSPDQTFFTGSTLLIDPHINVTSNATMLRGIYYNPTISASVNTNHIAIETATGSIIFRNLPTSSTVTNVLLYDTASGQLYYTASNGIGGGSGTGAGFPFSGSAVITGSLLLSGSTPTLTVTGSINVSGSITGSLFGTSSWANNSISSSYVTGSIFVSGNLATSASFALTASNVQGGVVNYIPLWNAATTLSTSSIYQTGSLLGIRTTNPQYTLDVSGSGNYTNGLTVSGAFVVTTGSTEFQVLPSGIKMGNAIGDTHTITGSLLVSGNLFLSGSTVFTGSLNVIGLERISGSLIITGSQSISSSTDNVLNVIGSGSVNPLFRVQGSLGDMFLVSDSTSGSLFSVNNDSGLPIFEVFSDSTTKIGIYPIQALYTTNQIVANSGSQNTIYSLQTASYDGAFYDYTLRSGSHSRAGQIVAIWSGSSVNYTETATADFGNTSGSIFSVVVDSSGYMNLNIEVPSNSWFIKTIIRSI